MGRVNNKKKRFGSSDPKGTKDKEMKGKDTKPNHTSNDVAWYGKSNQLINDVGSLSFYTALGNAYDMGYDQYYGGKNTMVMPINNIPGVMALDIHLCVGKASDPGDPMNVAANLVYTQTRRANSGSWTYTAPSQMMYLLAMDSIYSTYNDLKRLYGIMTLYSPYNKYAPRAIVEAMGYDFEDMLEHMVDLRAYLNTICNSINARKVPATMDIMIRHSMLFSNIYADSSSLKAQLYVFRRDNYYLYDEYSEPARLQNVNRTSTLETFDDVVASLNDMLNKVMASQDCNVMSGDIEKAFGDSIFKVTPVEDYYQVIPVYDPIVLNQIHNCVITGEVTTDITEDPDRNCLVYTPTFSSSSPGYMINTMLDMITDDTSPSMIVESTRLIPTVSSEVKNDGANTFTCTFDRIGSEFVCGAMIYVIDSDGTLRKGIIPSHIRMTDLQTGGVVNLSLLAHLEKFRYHPSVTVWTQSDLTDIKTAQVVGTFYEANLFTVVDRATINRMHDAALFSEFGIVAK